MQYLFSRAIVLIFWVAANYFFSPLLVFLQEHQEQVPTRDAMQIVEVALM